MYVSYDVFVGAFLSKITEFDFRSLIEETREEIVDGYLKRAMYSFMKVSEYQFTKNQDDSARTYYVEVEDAELDEIADIISEGMIVQWLKPFLYNQELLQNALNTKDFTTYSPATLLTKLGDAHRQAQKNFKNMINQYSYDHGDLTDLHQ